MTRTPSPCNQIYAACKLLLADGWRISTVAAVREGNTWYAEIAVTNNVPLGWDWPAGDSAGASHAVSVDYAAIPPGVTVQVWCNRPPPYRVRLARESSDVYEMWIREVAAAGEAPDWCIYRAGAPDERILTKPIAWLGDATLVAALRDKYAAAIARGPRRVPSAWSSRGSARRRQRRRDRGDGGAL